MLVSQIIGFAMIVAAAGLYLWLAKWQRKYDEQRITCHVCVLPSRRIDCREYAPGKWVCNYCDHDEDIT
jgi:hypothetical protein